MVEQQLLEAQATLTVEVRVKSGDYLIICDITRKHNQPKWYVWRLNDRKVSQRFYLRSEGAFSALMWNRINWKT